MRRWTDVMTKEKRKVELWELRGLLTIEAFAQQGAETFKALFLVLRSQNFSNSWNLDKVETARSL